MKLDELKEKATQRVKDDNPDGTNFKINKVYEHLMGGVLISVSFQTSAGKDDFNHVHFRGKEIRTFRWHADVLNSVATSREHVWFFRFIELAGIGGVIAFILILIFSTLLSALAFSKCPIDPSVLEVVKLSFTIILGYFFGSQTKAKSNSQLD